MVELALDPFSSLCTTDTLRGAQKGQYFLKYQQFQKNLCETVVFFPTLQLCSPKFLTSANTDSRENVSFDCSEIAVKLPEKDL